MKRNHTRLPQARARARRTSSEVGRRLNVGGFSLIEAMVALAMIAIITTGTATYILTAAEQGRRARQDLQVWNAAHSQMEALAAQGASAVASGSATVNGLGMTWTVTGSSIKTIELIVQVPRTTGIRPDTFVTHLSDN